MKAEELDDDMSLKYAVRAWKQERIYRFQPRRRIVKQFLREMKGNLLDDVKIYESDPKDQEAEILAAESPKDGFIPMFDDYCPAECRPAGENG